MDDYANIDPELAPALRAFQLQVGGALDLSDLPALRAGMLQMVAAATEASRGAAARPGPAALTVTEWVAPGADGAPGVPVRLYRPTATSAPLPVLLWVHGGGFVLGDAAQDDGLLRALAEQVPCAVAAVDYRLAPEHPHPAPLEDCYAALRWLAGQAAGLGLDPERIAVGGASAGGGLAACLALLARDRAEVRLACQLLLYPMLDDRNTAPAGPDCPDTVVWTRENNHTGWNALLSGRAGAAETSGYAAAARAERLAGLPPAYIAVGACDLFLDEDIAYARRLLHAGVATELRVYAGAYHGFDSIAGGTAAARRFIEDRDSYLRRMLRAEPVRARPCADIPLENKC
ncbi:alpha/beta hydrolase [Pseudoduganella namucuonensis]|uniref:Acetyl esterase/lipase n=1 Tax=Pseudoduganella namucuonensis TaxID=1035707 RepID=A0A1I7LSJ6_9BURK|nr:alpha/beta hydrolase [Pseudoduganella namucuonensis]SFV12666.1 Acetyl esterase/lipase [Pseudoduganella namucuonensis]